jgi:hypothetical protein
MKIAYAIQAHKNPQQVARLFEALAAPGDAIALAYDVKAGNGFVPAIREAMGPRWTDAIRVLPPTNNAWGGYSLPAALIDCYAELVRHGGDWDYVVNLSGQCLPTRPIPELRAMLAASGGANFLECFEVESDWPEVISRVRTYHVEFRGRARNTHIPRLARRDFRLYGGSAFMMLSRPFVEHLLRDAQAQHIARWFRNTLIPDELLFQTTLMNSPFRDTLVPKTNRLVVGLGMMPRGEVGLIFLGLGSQAGILSAPLEAAILLMVIGTTFLAPVLLRIVISRQPAPIEQAA